MIRKASPEVARIVKGIVTRCKGASPRDDGKGYILRLEVVCPFRLPQTYTVHTDQSGTVTQAL